MAASEWSVLIFGDSWADYSHPCWPQVLARRMGAKVFNFAQAGSMCGDLTNQGQRALMSPQVPKSSSGTLRAETLIVVHTCGNDFIMKMAEALMGGGGLGMLLGGGMPPGGAAGPMPEMLLPNPGAREATILTQFMENMHRGGARNFLISGVPIFLEMPIFNIAWPMVAGMVNSGKLEALGVSPGDPPRLAVEVQASALHERWEELVKDFSNKHSDSKCVFFDEVAALEKLRMKLGEVKFDRSMWDFSMFHPTVFGHEQLASEAHRVTAENFTALAALAPHSEAAPAPAAAPAAPAAVPAPAAAGYAGGMSQARREQEEEERQLQEALALSLADQTSDEAKPMTIQVRNVKGDVSFSVTCDGRWTAPKLRQQVLEAAPASFAPAGCTCVLALKGKFLGEGTESLEQLGLTDGTQIIAVVKPAKANS